MKRLLMVAVLAVCLVAGCVGEVKTYTDSGRTIEIGCGREFVIALGSNRTTGYSWQAGYDDNMLELVAKTYEPGDKAQDVAGAGGVEFFRFKTLGSGEAEVTLVYKRLWEEPSPNDVTRVFIVNIK